MADCMACDAGGILNQRMPPHLILRGRRTIAMIEILFMYQLARNPLQAIARRWWCRSLYPRVAGSRRCAECTGSDTVMPTRQFDVRRSRIARLRNRTALTPLGHAHPCRRSIMTNKPDPKHTQKIRRDHAASRHDG